MSDESDSIGGTAPGGPPAKPTPSSTSGPGNPIRKLSELLRAAQTPVALTPDGRKTFLEKWSTLILCFTFFAAPFVLNGAVKSLKVYASDVRQWLPKGFQEAQEYDQFEKRFGVDEMVVVSWSGCTIDSPQVRRFQNALETATNEDGLSLFSKVITGPDLIAQIEAGGNRASTAQSRLEGLLIGPDGKQTCLLAYPKLEFKDQRRVLVERVYSLGESVIEVSPEDLHLGGPTVDGAAIEIESKRSLGTYLWMSVVAVFLLTWLRMRDLPLTMLVIVYSGFCASLSLSIMYYTGGKMNLTMVMLPTLTFILGVSGSVHMVNYYRKASTLGFGMRAADQALLDGLYPILLSSTTTAVGLMSLATSAVLPIKMFGFYAACGILASTLVILLVLPATLYLLRGRISRRFSATGPMNKRERLSGVSRSTSSMLNWVCRHHGWVVVPTIVAVALLATGIFQLQASVKIQNRFAQRTKIISDYRWLEENLGPLVPMEVEIRVGPENSLSRWQQMQMVQSIERSIRQTTAVNATLSAGTFEPYVPRGLALRDRITRRAKIEKWNTEFQRLEDAGLVKVIDDTTYWRISLRVAALNEIDYGGFLETVGKNVNQQIQHIDQPDVVALLTGGIPLVYKAQHQILSDLMVSFLTAFLIITVIMVIVMRSVQAGVVAMIPNVFPPLVVFGAMGWLGISIEIGSVMTASVALGIAVDDTLHFLTWYRRGTVEGLSRFACIRHAFEHCAKAMIDTSLICGLGVAPFLFGVFMPTAKFAALLMVMLFTALPGDLILLPAMLVGPIGILFRLKRKPRKKRITGTLEIETEPGEPLETIRREA